MPGNTDHIARALTTRFSQLYPDEAAALFEKRSGREIAAYLEAAEPGSAAALLKRLRPDAAAEVLEILSDESLRRLAPLIDPARAAAALARLDADRCEQRLQLLSDDLAQELRVLMSFPADSAGGIMDPRIMTFRPETTVNEVVERLRARRREKRISDVFLVNSDGSLAGGVALQDLVVAEPGDQVGALVRKPPVSVQSTAPREEVVELLEQTKAVSLPVVDFEGRVMGVIRQDALLAAAQQEATLDLQKMVGVSKDERALSNVWFAVRRRLPWLQINLGTAFLAAFVVGIFEGTIARFTALAVLLPVVAGQSGNTGAQALAVTMRGLALREVRARHWFRLALKETGAGAVNGVAVALVTGLAVLIWSQSVGLALVIATAMVMSMVIAGLAGASIPIVLTKLGQDPASAASIILTTVTDVMGFLSFLGLATLAAGFL